MWWIFGAYENIDHAKIIRYIIMFSWILNVQLGGEVLKHHNLKLKVMPGVEHTVYLFLMMFLKYQF